MVEQKQSLNNIIKYKNVFGCDYLYLVLEENMKAKTKCNHKDCKDDQAFQESVEDIMENGDVLSDERHLSQVYKKVYPCEG